MAVQFSSPCRRASPSMRDAIQGMLSMSRGDDLSLSALSERSRALQSRMPRDRAYLKRKFMYDDDSGERMPTCYKDEEYGELMVFMTVFVIVFRYPSFYYLYFMLIFMGRIVNMENLNSTCVEPSFTGKLD